MGLHSTNSYIPVNFRNFQIKKIPTDYVSGDSLNCLLILIRKISFSYLTMKTKNNALTPMPLMIILQIDHF